ncbi:hypothetical protein [Virgibacillus halodenitrificans]|uniref:hypothetical protein n=1 Tax=Virgibacillus halodenitrificans TaxID=1482 RepID=UPI0002D84FF4|nr:hypothetical protein [Virgibacillus halodenitrificans]
MVIELNYIKNEGDVQRFAENYYEYSPSSKKSQKWFLLSLIIISLIVAYPLHKLFGEGPLFYFLLLFILLVVCLIPGLKMHKKDTIKHINKTFTSKYTGILGEHKAILGNQDIHLTYLPNNFKQRKNMTSKWEEMDFYNRDKDHFFIYSYSYNRLTYHLIAGSQSEEVDNFLSDKGLIKKSKKFRVV